MKLTIDALFSFALVVVGGLQACVLSRQAEILSVQTDGQRRQLRPYVSILSGSIFATVDAGGTSNAKITLKVDGETPALNVEIVYGFGSADLTNSIDPITGTTLAHEGQAVFTQDGKLATSGVKLQEGSAGKAFYSRIFGSVSEEINANEPTGLLGPDQKNSFAMQSLNVHPTLTGSVTYEDGFGLKYKTPFCFVYLKDNAEHECSTTPPPT